MTGPIRIAIADDHAMFREGVKSILRRRADLRVLVEAERVDDIAPRLACSPCDVLLLDLQMDRSSLSAVPDLARLAAVVVLTMSERPEDAIAAVRAGAHAVVFKRFAIATLFEALRAVAAGHVWLPPALQDAVIAGLRGDPAEPISPREREVIRHVALGQRNAEVARRLFISEETVKKHLNTIFHKLGVRGRVQLTLYAIQSGIVTPSERRA